ncbi:Conserved_hypothetical protein [Hexamita inflata]|uniref:Uncharacterized protein n=1 Tax=Hexamita inflata TaxID=28002 RepID=A0AA86QT08_9EUKA|nr:Conserved hypothetical protein [Hexamita inflata]CAI9962542.1 Conserved hypothetical protein [Hexamita inflata]
MHGRRLGRRACYSIIRQPGAEMQARRCRREKKRRQKAKCRRKRAGRPESRRKAAITRQAREIEELSKSQSTRFKAVSSPGSPKLAVAVALATDFLPELELPASSRRVRRRTERKVRANAAQAQAEARKAGGRRTRLAQSGPKARQGGSNSATKQAREPKQERKYLTQGETSSRQLNLTRQASKDSSAQARSPGRRRAQKQANKWGQNNAKRRNQYNCVPRKGTFTLPHCLYKFIKYHTAGIAQRGNACEFRPSRRPPTRPVQLPVGEVFIFAPFLQPRRDQPNEVPGRMAKAAPTQLARQLRGSRQLQSACLFQLALPGGPHSITQKQYKAQGSSNSAQKQAAEARTEPEDWTKGKIIARQASKAPVAWSKQRVRARPSHIIPSKPLKAQQVHSK